MLTSKRVVVSRSIDVMYEQMYERGWTDGLPIIPATEERVQTFVDYLGRDAGEVVAEIPPDNAPATIENIATNAVMAGCRPEYMPVLVAAIEAIAEPQFGLDVVQVTTNPVTPFLIINGPIRQQVEINCGANALGQGWRANATIGRALRLVMVNIGGALPGSVDKATLGHPGKFTMCLGENEEESPWVPLHVERGLPAGQNAVTVVPAASTLQLCAHIRGADDILTLIAHSISAMATNDMIAPMEKGKHNEPVIILCPSHAKTFADAGMSKHDVKRILWERGRLPVDWFPKELAEQRRAIGLVMDEKVALVHEPENLIVVVAGGPSGLHATFVPTLGVGFIAVTKPIKLH